MQPFRLWCYEFYNARSKNITASGWLSGLSASHAVGREFASWSGHIKDHHRISLPPFLARRHLDKSLAMQLDCLKGRVVYGIV